MLRVAANYCALIALVFGADLVLSLVPYVADVIGAWQYYVGLVGFVSAFFVTGALFGVSNMVERRGDPFRGCSTWAGVALTVLVVAHLALAWIGVGVGVNAIPFALFAAVHYSGARVWGSPRMCVYGHDAGFSPRYCPTCGARTQDRFEAKPAP